MDGGDAGRRASQRSRKMASRVVEVMVDDATRKRVSRGTVRAPITHLAQRKDVQLGVAHTRRTVPEQLEPGTCLCSAALAEPGLSLGCYWTFWSAHHCCLLYLWFLTLNSEYLPSGSAGCVGEAELPAEGRRGRRGV